MTRRDERLEKIVRAVHKLQEQGDPPSKQQLKASILETWGLSESTARTYLRILYREDRVTSDAWGRVRVTEAERERLRGGAEQTTVEEVI